MDQGWEKTNGRKLLIYFFTRLKLNKFMCIIFSPGEFSRAGIGYVLFDPKCAKARPTLSLHVVCDLVAPSTGYCAIM